MKEQTADIIRSIRSRIDETRKRLYRQELLMRSVTAYSVIALLGGILMLLESVAHFGEQVRTVLFYSYWTVSVIIAVALVGKPLLRVLGLLPKRTDEEMARLIGARFEKIGDRLENALDLADMLQNGDLSASPELIEVSLEHFQRTTSHVNFGGIVSFSAVKSLLRAVGAVTLVAGVITAVADTPFGQAAERLWNHDVPYDPAVPFYIEALPGNTDIIKGEPVTLSAVVRLNPAAEVPVQPSEVVLSFADEGVVVDQTLTLRPDSAGMFRHRFAEVRNPFTYSFAAAGIVTERFTVAVNERPFIRSLSVSLTPPAYTRLARQTLDENVGDILAFAGTRVRWSIVPSTPGVTASVALRNGRTVPFVHEGERYTAEFTLTAPTAYHIRLEDANGTPSAAAIEYRADILPDRPPAVDVVLPGRNLDVTKAMQLPMEFRIGDDFGISKMELAFRLVQSRLVQEEKTYGIILPFDTLNSTNDIVNYEWDLSLLGLVPEDVVEYYAVVYDNDPVAGPKSARSQTYLIRLPSLEEVFSDADKEHESALAAMEQTRRDAEEMKKEIGELAKELKRSQQMDWQKEKKAEEIARRFQEVQKQVESVQRRVDEMTQNLHRNNTLSPETMERYMELQKLMQELNSPEFQQAMKRMQQAMQNVSPEQMREAMQQIQFSEEQFRTSIDRTLSLLKRIQVEQKVDELVKRAQEMKQQQEEIAAQTEQLKQNDPAKAAELARRQEELTRQLEQLKGAMAETRSRMEEFPKEMPLDRMEAAQQAARSREMSEPFKRSAQALRSMQTEQALTAQQQASSRIGDLADQIGEMQEQMLNGQMQQTMNGLRNAMNDLLQLSQKQEQLKNRSRTLDPNSQQFRDVAQQQQALRQDLDAVANALAGVAERSFAVTPEMGKQIGRAMAQMQQSQEAVEARNGAMASSGQAEAMASLNKAATLVQGSMQAMQQQGGGQGGGSLMQQLRSMAMQQQSINMQTQQLGQRQGMTQQQMAEVGRLARQQDAVRKSLEQMQNESRTAPERQRVLGDLGKIADEMKEVVDQLRQNDVDNATLQQQERILSRLLQAQRSTRERDYEQRRRAVAGVTPMRRPAVPAAQQPAEERRRRDLQRALEAGYSKEYLELIRRYYEAVDGAGTP